MNSFSSFVHRAAMIVVVITIGTYALCAILGMLDDKYWADIATSACIVTVAVVGMIDCSFNYRGKEEAKNTEVV